RRAAVFGRAVIKSVDQRSADGPGRAERPEDRGPRRRHRGGDDDEARILQPRKLAHGAGRDLARTVRGRHMQHGRLEEARRDDGRDVAACYAEPEAVSACQIIESPRGPTGKTITFA